MKDKVRIRIGLGGEDTWGEYQAIKALNETINNLWILSDTDWYLNRAFGLETSKKELIDKYIDEDELMEFADKLEIVRAILINRVLDNCNGNYEEFERAILKSTWESGKDFEVDKERAKEEYQKTMRDAEHLKEYYSKRYGEDISLDE